MRTCKPLPLTDITLCCDPSLWLTLPPFFSRCLSLQIVITPGDTIGIPFEGGNEAALAVSLQQCSGNTYIRMSMYYNNTALFEDTSITSNRCNRVSCPRTPTPTMMRPCSHPRQCEGLFWHTPAPVPFVAPTPSPAA